MNSSQASGPSSLKAASHAWTYEAMMIAPGGRLLGEVPLLRGEGEDAVEAVGLVGDRRAGLDLHAVVAHLPPVEPLQLVLGQLDQSPVRPLRLRRSGRPFDVEPDDVLERLAIDPLERPSRVQC